MTTNTFVDIDNLERVLSPFLEHTGILLNDTKTEVDLIRSLVDNLVFIHDVDYNDINGDVTFVFSDNSTLTINIFSDNLAKDISYDSSTKSLIVTKQDGTELKIDVVDLVDMYLGSDGSHIQIVIGHNNTIQATLKSGTISENELTTSLKNKINNAQDKLNRTVTGNDNATGAITDTGNNLSIPMPVTVAAPSASSTQITAGTRTLRATLKILIDNIANLFSRVGTAETQVNLKANIASPALTGTPTVPTPSANTNNTQIATTAFVHNVAGQSASSEISTANIKSNWSSATGLISGRRFREGLDGNKDFIQSIQVNRDETILNLNVDLYNDYSFEYRTGTWVFEIKNNHVLQNFPWDFGNKDNVACMLTQVHHVFEDRTYSQSGYSETWPAGVALKQTLVRLGSVNGTSTGDDKGTWERYVIRQGSPSSGGTYHYFSDWNRLDNKADVNHDHWAWLPATTNSDTTTTTPLVGTNTIQSILQTIWNKIRSVVNALAGKENTIAAGTTAQYWRGDKTWQTFPTIPAAAGNGTLTIQRHGVSAGTFAANQSANTTINIIAPTWAEVTGKPTTFDPTSHASTATTFGQGSPANYGHLKQTATARTAAATSDSHSLGTSFGQYALSVTHMGTQNSINLNNFTANGDFLFYNVTTRTNFPTLPSGANTSNPSFYLEVRQHAYQSNNTRQKLSMRGATGNTSFNMEFTRQNNQGTWTPWVRMATIDDIPSGTVGLTSPTFAPTSVASTAISTSIVNRTLQGHITHLHGNVTNLNNRVTSEYVINNSATTINFNDREHLHCQISPIYTNATMVNGPLIGSNPNHIASINSPGRYVFQFSSKGMNSQGWWIGTSDRQIVKQTLEVFGVCGGRVTSISLSSGYNIAQANTDSGRPTDFNFDPVVQGTWVRHGRVASGTDSSGDVTFHFTAWRKLPQ